MFKIVLLLTFISFTCGGYVDKFVGSYVIAAAFPENVGFPNCDKYTFSIGNRVNCECFGREDFKLLEFGIPNVPKKSDLAIIDVTEARDIDFALLTPKCVCGGISYKNLVVRYINDDFFAYYELFRDPIANTTTRMVNVFSKTIPNEASLNAAIKTVPDLKDRKYKTLCVA